MANAALIETGPGLLYYAPLGSTEPTAAATAGVLSDTIPAAWLLLGYTDNGHTFNVQLNADPVPVEELLDPVKYASTGRTISVAFSLAEISPLAEKVAFNGGTATTTGSTGTSLTTYSPPSLGQEVRTMLLWQSDALDHRVIWRQCLNTGQIAQTHQKGANKNLLACAFNVEAPATGLVPFQEWFAGVRSTATAL